MTSGGRADIFFLGTRAEIYFSVDCGVLALGHYLDKRNKLAQPSILSKAKPYALVVLTKNSKER